MDLSVVLVSFNVREQLAECLASVEESGGSLCTEVVVVDNASQDASAEMVRQRFPRVRLIQNAENRGFARACNQGLRVSRGRYVLLLNPDSLLVGDCLPRLVDFMDAHPRCGAATCRVWLDRQQAWVISNCEVPSVWREVLVYSRWLPGLLTPRRLLERHWRRRWDLLLAEDPLEVECIQGNFVMVRAALLSTVGGLDERFFMYYEDADWSRRIRQEGWALSCHPGVGVVHHTSQSAKGAHSSLGPVLRISQRYFLRKHFGILGAFLVRSVLAADSRLAGVAAALKLPSRYFPCLNGPTGVLDLMNGPDHLSWPRAPGATRYVVELSLNPLFLGTAGRAVSEPSVELALEELRKPGFFQAYWRVVPFRGDRPLAK